MIGPITFTPGEMVNRALEEVSGTTTTDNQTTAVSGLCISLKKIYIYFFHGTPRLQMTSTTTGFYAIFSARVTHESKSDLMKNSWAGC